MATSVKHEISLLGKGFGYFHDVWGNKIIIIIIIIIGPSFTVCLDHMFYFFSHLTDLE
jgi:hypothetical protein